VRDKKYHILVSSHLQVILYRNHRLQNKSYQFLHHAVSEAKQLEDRAQKAIFEKFLF